MQYFEKMKKDEELHEIVDQLYLNYLAVNMKNSA
jgi:hypothetical protein